MSSFMVRDDEVSWVVLNRSNPNHNGNNNSQPEPNEVANLMAEADQMIIPDKVDSDVDSSIDEALESFSDIDDMKNAENCDDDLDSIRTMTMIDPLNEADLFETNALPQTSSIATMTNPTATTNSATSTDPPVTAASASTSTDQSINMVNSETSTEAAAATESRGTATEPAAASPLQIPEASQTEQPSVSSVNTQTVQEEEEDPKEAESVVYVEQPRQDEANNEQDFESLLEENRRTIATLVAENQHLQAQLKEATQQIDQLRLSIQQKERTADTQLTLEQVIRVAEASNQELHDTKTKLQVVSVELNKLNFVNSTASEQLERACRHCQAYAAALLRILENGTSMHCEPETQPLNHLLQVTSTNDNSQLAMLFSASLEQAGELLHPLVDAVVTEHLAHQKQQQQQTEQKQEPDTRFSIVASDFKVNDNALFIADPTGTFFEAFNVGSPNYIVSGETLTNCSLNPKKLARFVGTIINIENRTAQPRNPFKLTPNTPYFICDVMLH